MTLRRQARHSLQGLTGLLGHSNRRVRRKKPGQAPGTLLHTGQQQLDQMLMTVHDYDTERCQSLAIDQIDASAPYLGSSTKTWIQVRGLHDVERLQQVMDYFELHPLIQEDILSISQRPKVEPYGEVIFVVLRMIRAEPAADGRPKLKSEQVSLVLGSNYVLTFQESDDTLFDPVIRRLGMKNTRMRRHSVDYLAYALLDNLVDHYFSALDLVSETLEQLEEQVLEQPRPEDLQSIHALRRDLVYFRKSVWSLRDGINSLIRDDSPLITSDVKLYLRDVYDHLVQVIDSIENQREILFSLYDIYMSSLSSRMNEVMKLLTIIATIFIPLTFVAGIYGMNFNPEISIWNMPELNWMLGYPFALGLMASIAGGMLLYFRRRGWL
ncbi:magnesium/cobalt transporter CorA [Marinospirillum alkaliphilum]|uniref:Magnesium transport protein CorA n=1 Tax=Marinospirillum alkaliphilum DSM 21637 TaxID=1122209 RepID=A0A1K1ZGZ9_9GAMM|nr:magnesium/cobalt transporter CorA [Marinospirillum alkaliphilum]SFX72987.1 magnesium transporter [Marinospirillum alkaliphilum DSM 21637]